MSIMAILGRVRAPDEEIHCEILIDVCLIEELNSYLEDINKGKIGEPYHYPDLLIRMLSLLRSQFKLSYRELEL